MKITLKQLKQLIKEEVNSVDMVGELAELTLEFIESPWLKGQADDLADRFLAAHEAPLPARFEDVESVAKDVSRRIGQIIASGESPLQDLVKAALVKAITIGGEENV